MTRSAWAHGIVTADAGGTVLEVRYPDPALGAVPASAAGVNGVPAGLASLAGSDPARGTTSSVVTTQVDLDAAPVDAADVWLRLHLLSHRLVAPGQVVLDGVFSLLATVVWTSAGPCAVAGFETARLRLVAEHGAVQVLGVDKFPRMLDYVVPAGVRVADAARVRLGAHLAQGTTVMHEGFVNFNAGTLGPAMVEGRISAGVVVGADSDVGGGASIMGTLSGGGTHRIRVGRRCLLGANAGLGISLGDDCVVEAGLYVTAGTRVSLVGGAGAGSTDGAGGTGGLAGAPRVVKAAELSGADGLLFRRNSVSGAVEALARDLEGGRRVDLNAVLHAN